MQSHLGHVLVEFMRSRRGKKIDKVTVKVFGFSLLSHLFAARAGFEALPVLRLYTTGQVTGKERMTVMPYFEHGT
ncbi:hypothetical protein ACWD7C_25555 [Streptomyces sp. NPDC005134]|uniref:hypothetical protein n=1 Tax=Streptomyces sp. NPDC005098 TaxID=3154560 RepID=UPI0033A54E76